MDQKGTPTSLLSRHVGVIGSPISVSLGTCHTMVSLSNPSLPMTETTKSDEVPSTQCVVETGTDQEQNDCLIHVKMEQCLRTSEQLLIYCPSMSSQM